MGATVLFIVGVIIYFIPGIVGNSKRNGSAIWVLNFFLGWTLIGWVVALVWACTSDSPVTQYNNYTGTSSKSSKVDELERLKSLRDQGALTEAEFLAEKEKLLRS